MNAKEKRRHQIEQEFFQGDDPAFIAGVFDGASNFDPTREDEQYLVGYEYGRYALCFENARLFAAISILSSFKEEEEDD